MRGRVVAVLLVILMGVVLVKLYLGSQIFSLSQARIIGRLDSERYEQVADKLRLYRGRNLVSLDLSELARDIRESFPWVKNLSLSKRLPNVLDIEILMWEPAAVLDIGREYYVDSSGSRLSPCVGGDSPELPRIQGLDGGRSEPGVQMDQIRFALDLIGRVRDAGVQPTSIEFTGDSVVKVELSCGSILEFVVENAFDSIDWLVSEWGTGEKGLCRYGWAYVVRQGKVIVKRGI